MSKKPSKRYTGGRKISEIGRRPDGTYTEGLWSEKAVINRDKEAVYDEVIEEFYRLNGRRNRYVHGLWHTYQDRETAYLSERSDEEYHYLDGRRVEVGELEATVRDMDALHRKITKHIIVPAVSTRNKVPDEDHP